MKKVILTVIIIPLFIISSAQQQRTSSATIPCHHFPLSYYAGAMFSKCQHDLSRFREQLAVDVGGYFVHIAKFTCLLVIPTQIATKQNIGVLKSSRLKL